MIGKVLGLQITGGSSSTRDGFDRMRQAGAAARLMLMQAAAKKLGVPASELTTDNGSIVHKTSSRTLTYGEVASTPPRCRRLRRLRSRKSNGSCSASPNSASTCWTRSPARRSSASIPVCRTCSTAPSASAPCFMAKAGQSRSLQSRENIGRGQNRAAQYGLRRVGSASSRKTPGLPSSGRAIEVEWEKSSNPPDSAG